MSAKPRHTCFRCGATTRNDDCLCGFCASEEDGKDRLDEWRWRTPDDAA